MKGRFTLKALAVWVHHIAASVAQEPTSAPDFEALSDAGYEVYSDVGITNALSEMDPPFIVLVSVDYLSEQLEGQPAPRQEVRNIHKGAVVATDAIDCAQKCSEHTNCNMVSYYGDVPEWTDERNCWLKDLEQLSCSIPADLEKHSDSRLLLLAQPDPECNDEPVVAPLLPPRSPAPKKDEKNPPNPISPPGSSQQSPPDSTDPVQKETITTDEEKQTILGTREMDPSVPRAYEIENAANAAANNKYDMLFLISVAFAVRMLLF